MDQHRTLSLLFLALAAGLAGGLAGGLVVVVAPGGRGAADEAAMPSPVATAATPAATAVALGSAERLQRAIERVLPAVVTIIADGVPRRNEQGGITQQRNVGSGIVIDERGHIVTNFHVIDGAVEINVLLATGERRPAVIRSHDSPYSDLAVLSVSPEGLRSASLGDSLAARAGRARRGHLGRRVRGRELRQRRHRLGNRAGLAAQRRDPRGPRADRCSRELR